MKQLFIADGYLIKVPGAEFGPVDGPCSPKVGDLDVAQEWTAGKLACGQARTWAGTDLATEMSWEHQATFTLAIFIPG